LLALAGDAVDEEVSGVVLATLIDSLRDVPTPAAPSP
jgi:hypothetical protein